MFTILKIVAAIFWLVFAVNTFQPFAEPATSIIAWAGIILAVTHVIEFLIKKKDLDTINAGGVHGFSQTLLFGFVYWVPLLRKAE